MNRIGRNDACPCGSGQKYKKCCMASDEAANVVRIGSGNAPAAASPPISKSPEVVLSELIAKNQWVFEADREVAEWIQRHLPARSGYPETIIAMRIWIAFVEACHPIVRKPAAVAAAMEYIFHADTCTQKELAAKYGVSAPSIGKWAYELDEFRYELMNAGSLSYEPGPPGSQSGHFGLPGTAISAEQALHQFHSEFNKQQFESEEDIHAFIEQYNRNQRAGGFSNRHKDHSETAQELAFAAMNEPDVQHKLKLANQAISLDPKCADAWMIKHIHESRNPVQLLLRLKDLAGQAAEWLGGAAFFKEHEGTFWGFTETRPYMRIRLEILRMMVIMEVYEEAIVEALELLNLNPMDNQGIRYELINIYLLTGQSDAFRKLDQAYEESTIAFAYGRVIAEYQKHGLSTPITKSLKQALKANRFVPKLLSDFYLNNKNPGEAPDYFSPGSLDEARAYINDSIPLWESFHELIKWMVKNSK